MTLTKISAGRYETTVNGRLVQIFTGRYEHANDTTWRFVVDGEWWQSYGTKAAAAQAIDECIEEGIL